MNRKILKIIAIVIAAVAALSSVPVFAYEREGDFTYYEGLKGAKIKKYFGDDAEVVVPSELGGLPVVAIGEYAFDNKKTLRSVVIPDGVELIEMYAFYDCSSLEDVSLPNSLTEIGECAFSGCSSLESFRFPDGVEEIGGGVFAGCTSLVSVVFPEGLEVIRGGMFAQNSSLESIVIPDTVRVIGSNAFLECTALKRVEIPSSVEHIFDYAFAWCTALEEIVIPEGVMIIDYCAFSHCESLRRISFPGSVNQAGADLFYECYSIEEINYGESKEKWEMISEGFASEVADALISFTNGPLVVEPAGIFRDVHENEWYAPFIDYVYSYGIMKGAATAPDGVYFLPEDTMTRAMMVTVIWRLEDSPESSKLSGFSDLKEDWYRDAVEWAAESGVVMGTGKGTFSPDGLLTREQICTMMYRYAKYKGESVLDNGRADFADSGKISPWAKDAVNWAVTESGLIVGEKKGGKMYLDPQGNATRAQIATILTRYLEGHNETLNETCREKGHLLISSFAEETVHNVFDDSPHCQRRIWEIFTCAREGCGFIRKVLRSVKRVSYCHG